MTVISGKLDLPLFCSPSEPNELPIKTILNQSLRFSSSALTSVLLEPRLKKTEEKDEKKKALCFVT